MQVYQVVACPRCRRAKVVESGKHSTTCASCSRPIDLDHVRAFHTGTDAEDARHAAGLVNARLSGRESEFGASFVPDAPRARVYESPVDAAAAAARRASSVADRVDRVARELASQMGEFAEEDLMDAFLVSGLPPRKLGDQLRRLVMTNVVFEHRPGSYRLV